MAVGLVTCEQVIVEDRTKNITLVNCFGKRLVQTIPSEPHSFAVFALLTDG